VFLTAINTRMPMLFGKEAFKNTKYQKVFSVYFQWLIALSVEKWLPV